MICGSATTPCGPARRRGGGFTLVEMLIVVAIIILLIAILVPVLNRVRIAGWCTATAARISNISQACNQYCSAYGSYPGILPEEALITSTNASQYSSSYSGPTGVLTSTENCVLSLQGGWVAGQTYDYTKVGLGAWRFNPAAQLSPFGELKSLGIQPAQSQPTGQWQPYNTNPLQTPLGSASIGVSDTAAPEFRDCFPDQMPIIYLRARPGNVGIATPDSTAPTNGTCRAQYDAGQVSPYLTQGNVQQDSNGKYWFPDADLYPAVPGVTGPYPLNQMDSADVYFTTGAGNNSYHSSVKSYVVHPNEFNLIAAGADRKYGTNDDQRN